MSNLEKLANAGLISPDQVPDHQKDVINNDLTEAEINALLSAHQKLGGEGSMDSGRPHATVF